MRRAPPDALNTSNMSFRAAKEVPIPFAFLLLRPKNDFLMRAILVDAVAQGLRVPSLAGGWGPEPACA